MIHILDSKTSKDEKNISLYQAIRHDFTWL
jgi:hypothetical protein